MELRSKVHSGSRCGLVLSEGVFDVAGVGVEHGVGLD